MPGPTFRLLRILAAAVVLFVFLNCILDRHSGRGSEVENEVYGVLVDASGDPVAGARVRAAGASEAVGKVSASPRQAADIDSTVTDAKGRYRFDSLATGKYDLFGDDKGRNLVVLIPGVAVTARVNGNDVGTDTLRAPGRLRGTLTLAGKGQPGVLCFVPGTSFLSVSDDSGHCLLDKVPQGRYLVRYSQAGFIIPSDTARVLAGRTTELPPKALAYDTALPPPAPAGLKVVYDTLAEEMRLSWSPVPVGDLAGYVVFRTAPNQKVSQELEEGFTADTVFIDSALGDLDTIAVPLFSYRLRSRDSADNLSAVFSAAVTRVAAPRRLASTTLAWVAPKGGSDSVLTGDSLAWAFEWGNPGRGIGTVEWRWPGGDPIKPPIHPLARSGRDSLTWKADSVGERVLRVIVTDSAGTEWKLERSIKVFPPEANRPHAAILVHNPEIFSGSTVSVSAEPSRDAFGRIVRYEWRDQGGMFAEPLGGGRSRSFPAPEKSGDSLTIGLRITDDDGLQDSAFVTLPVRAGSGWERMAGAGLAKSDRAAMAVFQDRMWVFGMEGSRLQAMNSADGSAWDKVDPLSLEYTTALGAVTHGGRLWLFARAEKEPGPLNGRLYSTDGVAWKEHTLPAALANRDAFAVASFKGRIRFYGGDDGNRSYGDAWSTSDGTDWTLDIGLVASGPRVSTRLAAWKERLWLYGGARSRNGFGFKALNDVWSSANGVDWELSTDSALASERWGTAFAAFQDGLWVIGGSDGLGTYNEIWRSTDGRNWSLVPGTPPFTPQRPRIPGEYRGRLWLLGGWSPVEYDLNQVWRSP